MKINKKALHESIVDTGIGLPLNWIFAYLVLLMLNVFGVKDLLIISLTQVAVLTVIAIRRKYCVRVYYGSKK